MLRDVKCTIKCQSIWWDVSHQNTSFMEFEERRYCNFKVQYVSRKTGVIKVHEAKAHERSLSCRAVKLLNKKKKC